MMRLRDQTASDWLELRTNAEIVRFARAGHPPIEIEAMTGIPVDTIYNKLRRARELGIAIAKFASVPPPRSLLSRAGYDSKPAPVSSSSNERSQWSADDDRRLADLLRRDVRLTAAAAFLRRPYADISRAAERLGLTRTRQMET